MKNTLISLMIISSFYLSANVERGKILNIFDDKNVSISLQDDLILKPYTSRKHIFTTDYYQGVFQNGKTIDDEYDRSHDYCVLKTKKRVDAFDINTIKFSGKLNRLRRRSSWRKKKVRHIESINVDNNIASSLRLHKHYFARKDDWITLESVDLEKTDKRLQEVTELSFISWRVTMENSDSSLVCQGKNNAPSLEDIQLIVGDSLVIEQY